MAKAAFGRKPPLEGASGPKRVPYKKKRDVRMGLCREASAFLLLVRFWSLSLGLLSGPPTWPRTTSAHWETPNLNRQDGGLGLWVPAALRAQNGIGLPLPALTSSWLLCPLGARARIHTQPCPGRHPAGRTPTPVPKPVGIAPELHRLVHAVTRDWHSQGGGSPRWALRDSEVHSPALLWGVS